MTLGYTGGVPASGYVEINHTADWALRVHGVDLADLLQQAAAGMLALAGALPVPDATTQPRTLRLQAADRETLLVRWLEELLFLLENQGLLPGRIQLEVGPGLQLEARLELGPVGRLSRAIKAVTFHGLHVIDTSEGVEATLVFDV